MSMKNLLLVMTLMIAGCTDNTPAVPLRSPGYAITIFASVPVGGTFVFAGRTYRKLSNNYWVQPGIPPGERSINDSLQRTPSLSPAINAIPYRHFSAYSRVRVYIQ